MFRKVFFSCLFCFILCVPKAVHADGMITIAGTGDSQELLRELAAAFEAEHPGRMVVVPDSVGSSGGIKMVVNGTSELARVARPLKEKEMAHKLTYQVFAVSPVVFAANIDKDCAADLSYEQIIDIYSGEIADWSVLGNCPPMKIYVASREEGDSSRSVLEKSIPAFKTIGESVGETVFSTPELIAILTSVRGTIAYTSLAALEGEDVQIFRINGVAPEDENILKGSYHLHTPFALVWQGELQGLAADFVDYLYGPAAQKIMGRHGVVPVARESMAGK